MSQFAPGAGLCRCAVGHFGPRSYAACRQACSVVAGQNGSKMVGEFADTGIRHSWPRTWRSMGRHQSSASMQLASPPSPQPNVARKNCRGHQGVPGCAELLPETHGGLSDATCGRRCDEARGRHVPHRSWCFFHAKCGITQNPLLWL